MQREPQPDGSDCDSSLTDLGPYLGPDLDDDTYEDYLAQYRIYDL